MRCIKCNSATDVYDTRLIPGEGSRRKRKCVKCGFRFATIEILDTVRELKEREPAAPKPEKKPRLKKVRQPKPPRTRAEKPRRPEDDVYEPEISDDIWDVARELGIEGYR